MAEEVDVTKCPDCDQQGRYDGRVLLGGRGIYTCPDGHRWQNADEKPTMKGAVLLSRGLRNPRDLLTPEDSQALHDDLAQMAKRRRQAEVEGRGKGLG